MSTPEDRVNSILPFLDCQQAAALLIWLKTNKICDVDAPLDQLLDAYPIDWAHEELNRPMSNLPMNMAYVDKNGGSRESAAWSDLLKATLALRGPSPDSSFDFSKTPGRILELMDALENQLSPSLDGGAIKAHQEALHQMAWLLHWTFWILLRYYLLYVKNQAGSDNTAWSEVIDQLFTDKALQTVSIVCPHLVRYYVVLILPDRKRTEHVWLLVSVMTSIRYKLADPYVDFALHIFNDTNLISAQIELKRIAQIKDDYFLSNPLLRSNLLKNARLLVFEHYCRVHRSLSMDVVRSLAIGEDIDSEENDEKWIVNLIKDAKVEAKIDPDNNVIHMTSTPVNPYVSIIEKSKNTFYKTNQLIKMIRN